MRSFHIGVEATTGDMAFEYRLITDDELVPWRQAVRRGFVDHVHPEDIERLRNDRIEMDRAWGAFDGGELVGTGGVESHMLTVPGGRQLPMAGIAYAGTAASHRRRGVLSGMVRTLLGQAVERGDALAGLWASEASIYGRFGFGMATQQESWSIETHHSAFASPVQGKRRVRFVEEDEAMKLFPAVYDRLRQSRHGFVDRHSGLWRYLYFDDPRVRGGWSGLFYVVCEAGRKVEGFAAYRLKEREEPWSDMQDMRVVECMAVSDQAYAALWRFLLDLDLVETLTAEARPVDDTLWWLLADPRRLRRWKEDGLWLRLLDPERALSVRSYRGTGKLVLEVRDGLLPGADGVYELEVSEGEAQCRRSKAVPDLSLSAAELGAVYLGGAKVSDLARAGRVREHTPGALALADSMFATSLAPWCAHHF